jgi:hypothetical protein
MTCLASRPVASGELATDPGCASSLWWSPSPSEGSAVRSGLFVTREVNPATAQIVVSSALRVYDLRYTCASLLIAQGASVKAVQAQLGHATASITLDTYGHLFPSELAALADRLEQVRTPALVNRERTQRGPSVVNLVETAGR